MAKRTGPTNEELVKEIRTLRKQKAAIWKRIAKDLEKPARKRRAVNLSRINRYTKDGDVVAVPGKVLASGSLNKKITIAAWQFSKSAEEKIKQSKSKTMSLSELAGQNPKGTNVKIIG